MAEPQAPKSQLCNVQLKSYLDCLESSPLLHTLGISQEFGQSLYIEFRLPSLGTSICGFSPHFLTLMIALNSVFCLFKPVRLQGFCLSVTHPTWCKWGPVLRPKDTKEGENLFGAIPFLFSPVSACFMYFPIPKSNFYFNQNL